MTRGNHCLELLHWLKTLLQESSWVEQIRRPLLRMGRGDMLE
jgi:hypothetical protein